MLYCCKDYKNVNDNDNDNDNTISTSVSEVVEKIPTDEKDDRKCYFTCFTLHSHSKQTA